MSLMPPGVGAEVQVPLGSSVSNDAGDPAGGPPAMQAPVCEQLMLCVVPLPGSRVMEFQVLPPSVVDMPSAGADGLYMSPGLAPTAMQ